MITRKDLERAIEAVNVAATGVKLGSRFELEHGSGTMGTSYRLFEFDANFVQPTVTEIAKSRNDALRYLEGFAGALKAVARDSARRSEHPKPIF
jgi:hypothetical protein